ncbi:FKBP-type peptidyl-prolyl cis-trans isomerase [Frigoriflavimonas asaccharolytica]|uniref:Peptidyl-prolyl cis-trans isomerase n=1 Tax=Frigoriflavimonas asaccharolytica TaxID=2735899 RepID=A0A8J8G8A7_9FLAO|nr:FKBP-type peptidyl-prolyl cis-trans isomerase [Frigoriflavimonas asaccharolytica]NRS93116.1 FKBP-type peptidyl-prolyl cis-trans isomerase [Frigoriflavimonas asaccharolytica]
MKKNILLLPVICFISLTCAQKKVEDATKLTEDQKASYYIGLNIAENMKQQGFAVDVDLLAQAMKEEIAGGKTLLPKEEMQSFMQSFGQKQQEKTMGAAKLKAEDNKKAGAAFMLKNKSNASVKTTASGLQYEVLKAGAGAKPKATDVVTVIYKGTLLDGTVFDSSEKQGGKPLDIPLNSVIRGWTEGVQLMSKGAKYKFYVPSDMGYGDQGGGAVIPPGATLIFEIKLVDFKDPAQ